MNRWKMAGFAAVSFFFFARAPYTLSAGELPWSVTVQSEEAFQGRIVRIDVAGKELKRVQGVLRGRVIPFFPEKDGSSYVAFLGVDLEEKARRVSLVIQGWRDGGKMNKSSVVLQIREMEFPREELSVPKSFDRLDKATLRRIERERGRMERLWQLSSPERLWEGPFLPPVPGEVSSPFGLNRIINGAPRSPHGGVDLRGPAGTKVVAPNHGRVVLREELFFAGKSIVLDHGGGLYTMYFHLSEFDVEKNSEVRKGGVIGRVGMTGRVTGPHLHWGARLNGARIDPFELTALK